MHEHLFRITFYEMEILLITFFGQNITSIRKQQVFNTRLGVLINLEIERMLFIK